MIKAGLWTCESFLYIGTGTTTRYARLGGLRGSRFPPAMLLFPAQMPYHLPHHENTDKTLGL